jgi:hypothetical protein
MNNLQKQCQTKLALEQAVIRAHLLATDPHGEPDGFDPVKQQVVREMRNKLHSVELALKRISDGWFGTCQICGHTIETDRLLTLPWAEVCVDCKRQLERATLGRRHPGLNHAFKYG